MKETDNALDLLKEQVQKVKEQRRLKMEEEERKKAMEKLKGRRLLFSRLRDTLLTKSSEQHNQ